VSISVSSLLFTDCLHNMVEAKDDPLQYWGYLFQKNKCATPKLDRLLRGIAACIVSRHP